jgi:four helix bundle protein
MQVVLKELREARFWLRLVERSNMVGAEVVDPTLREATELCNIIGKSIVTAKRQMK